MKTIRYDVWNWRAEKNSGEQLDNRVFMSRNFGQIVAPCKFDVLKTQASLLGQIFVLRTSHFWGATISRYFLDRNTLLFK